MGDPEAYQTDDEQINERFGANVRRYREDAGLSQEGLAELVDMHWTAIAHYEQGKMAPRLGNLIKLSYALDVLPGDLTEGIDWEPHRSEDEPGRWLVDSPAATPAPDSS